MQKSEQNILNKIKQLQNQDARNNAAQIKNLQQQAQQIQAQILQQEQSSSQSSSSEQSTPAAPSAGPAYILQIGQVNNHATVNQADTNQRAAQSDGLPPDIAQK